VRVLELGKPNKSGKGIRAPVVPDIKQSSHHDYYGKDGFLQSS
jgi:hypothetical protein